MKQKADYIKEISEITSRPYSDVEKEITDFLKDNDVTVREYYQNSLWELSLPQRYLEANRIIRRRNRRNGHFADVANALEITKKEVRAKLKALNEKGIFKMTIQNYANYELYRYDENEIDDVLHLFARRLELKRSIRAKLKEVYAGQLTYSDLDDEVNELYSIFERLMPESLYDKFAQKLAPSRPDILADEQQRRSVLLDMAVTKFMLGFGDAEYVSFHFAGKTLEEKCAFITDSERMKVIESINDPACFDYLDDKFQAYSRLKDYYDRKMIFISSDDNFGDFKEFCRRKKKIVIKPYCDSMGRGIKPVDLKWGTDVAAVFAELRKEYGSFIAEELIKPHKTIKTLNPDSVNTVRIITYFDGEKTIIHDTFMKVGKQGSFVDNGGAGGIFVHVNPETGVFDTPGCDETGVVYETHPDTGVRFVGYALPAWEQARALAMELSTKVPGLCYIGWDFTYTKKGQWIVVEGNAKTQFFGQQCTTNIGKRKDFIETVNYRPAE